MSIDASKWHDELLAAKPIDAAHDADSCPFCLERAAAGSEPESPASIPSGEQPLDVPTPNDPPEGGITTAMSDETLSRETHEALLDRALREATAATESALATKLDEIAALNGQVETLTADKAELVAEKDRLTSELDAAQLELRNVTDELAALRADIARAEAEEAKAALAAERASAVEGLFPAEYIAAKAPKWADLPEADWAERLEEWRTFRPASAPTADAASAMTGSSDVLVDPPVEQASQHTVSPRRAALGLS